MPDDRLQQSLDAYATQLQRHSAPAPAGEIRRRADRRRRHRAAGAAFAAVLVAAGGLGVLLNRSPAHPAPPAWVVPTPAVTTPSGVPPSPGRSRSGKTSNVTQLRQAGIDLGKGVLIDVADDGADRWMQIGAGDVVDFTGSAKDTSTEMELQPAAATGRNLVVIAPPGRPGRCVAATAGLPLTLQTCRDGDPAQTWQVTLAGDSGQFDLTGPNGVLTVDRTLIAAGGSGGRTGLQTIPFG